ncbi:peptidase M3 [Pseudactinotalea sp. HY158]|nr:peptidase M3 [Pseudactinotalea sp. HY158]
MDPVARRLLERVRRDFRRGGVGLAGPERTRIAAISEHLVSAGQEFARNIREDTRSIRVHPDRLAGLPPDWIADHPAEADGLVSVTTDYPDSVPFFMFAQDAEARRDLRLAYLNRAWPVNEEVLGRILALRREQAHLLGYASWADYDAEVKMIGSGPAIADFIGAIAAAALEPGRRDRDVVLERLRRDDPAATGVGIADAAFYTELVRRERFGVDAQEVRAYFDFERVRAGLLEVTGRLFGVEYRPVPDAPIWHEDVTCYDVYERDGAAGADGRAGAVGDPRLLGRIYLDLHPREGKFSHAAQFELVSGVAGRQLPEGVLGCNFGRGLLDHDDVVTLFHEFGHLLHHVFAGHGRWVEFSGVATEWDFVEAPSQLLEEWAWDARVLATFARNAAGETIPAELVARMRAADDFGQGLDARTQMFYAALSYSLHTEQVADLTAHTARLQGEYSLFEYLPGTHQAASFGHLDDYSSGYYTYMWSLVIAKDLFSAFAGEDGENGRGGAGHGGTGGADLFDPATARRYRETVLAPGGSKDAADLVADFLGRPYSFAPFERWLA